MNIKLQYKNFTVDRHLHSLIERRTSKARRMLPSYRSHDLDLHITLEQKTSSKQFQSTLVLTTPQTSIRVRDTEATAAACVGQSFDELIRKIRKFKSQLNRERFWHKDVKRNPTAEMGSEQADLEASINSNLDRIENYIRRELFYLAVSEPFAPESIPPQSVVDEVFYEVSSHLENRPSHVSLEQWMFQLAHEKVRARAKLARKESAELEFDADREEEIFHYYHPQEDIRFTDLLKEEGCNGKALAEISDLDEQIEAFIGHLEEPVREAFVLNVLEAFKANEVATITGQNPAQIADYVSRVRDQLRVQFCS